MKYCFGDIVVVDGNLIGVVVKSWEDIRTHEMTHEVYVRMVNRIVEYKESEMQRYMVRHKYLDDTELIYQQNAVKAGGRNNG